MKRIVAILLLSVMVLPLAGCGDASGMKKMPRALSDAGGFVSARNFMGDDDFLGKGHNPRPKGYFGPGWRAMQETVFLGKGMRVVCEYQR